MVCINISISRTSRSKYSYKNHADEPVLVRPSVYPNISRITTLANQFIGEQISQNITAMAESHIFSNTNYITTVLHNLYYGVVQNGWDIIKKYKRLPSSMSLEHGTLNKMLTT